MHSLALVPVLFGAAFVSAFTLPAGQPDGFYVAYYNETGHEVHEPVNWETIPQSFQPTLPGSSNLRERQFAGPPGHSNGTPHDHDNKHEWCGCSFELDHEQTHRACDDLLDQFSHEPRTIGPGKAFYVRNNSPGPGAVAFVCNRGTYAQSGLERKNIVRAFEVVNWACGWYIAGTSLTQRWPGLVAGYMTDRVNDQFCSDSQTASVDVCSNSDRSKGMNQPPRNDW